jgi:hypothetical protein
LRGPRYVSDDSDQAPSRARRDVRSAAGYVGAATSLIALGISIWSTRIAQETHQLQVEQTRRAQASQVLLFSDNPLFARPTTSAIESTDTFEDIFVQNYGRLPVPAMHLVAEFVLTEDGTIDDSTESQLLLYDLGPLAPCKQFRVDEFAGDAARRGPRGHAMFLSVEFTDVASERWVSELWYPVVPYEESRLFQSEFEFVPLAPAVAEQISGCAPG